MAVNVRRPGETRNLILVFVEEFRYRNGYSPTFREIAKGVGLVSPSTVKHHLETLRAQGKVQWNEGSPRSLRTT